MASVFAVHQINSTSLDPRVAFEIRDGMKDYSRIVFYLDNAGKQPLNDIQNLNSLAGAKRTRNSAFQEDQTD